MRLVIGGPTRDTVPASFALDLVHMCCSRSHKLAAVGTLGLRVPVRLVTRRMDYPLRRGPVPGGWAWSLLLLSEIEQSPTTLLCGHFPTGAKRKRPRGHH